MNSVADFKIVRSLGRGPMGETWLAEKQNDESGQTCQFVLKQVIGTEAELFAIRERFSEQRVHAAALATVGIVSWKECHAASESLWLVRDYIDGEPLAMTIVDHQLTPTGIHYFLTELATALEMIQKFGLVHGHVWLTNVFIFTDGSVRVTDMGLNPSVEIVERTKPGHLVSFSPERLRGDMPTAKDDSFALGALFQAAVAGHPPYHATKPEELRKTLLDSALPIPEDLNQPERHAERLLLESLIAKDPEERIVSPREIRASLAALGELRRIPERPAEPPRFSARQLIWLSVIMLVLIVLWLLYFFG